MHLKPPGARRGRVAATTIAVTIANLADVEHSNRTADRARERAHLNSRSDG